MPAISGWIHWLPTGLYATGALLCAITARERAWRVLAATTRGVVAIATLSCAIVLIAARATPGEITAALVTTLVGFLGWIIGDYSRRYLRGEPGQKRFLTAFLGTLAAVTAVLASRNLAVMIAAWAASSAALHHLLTYYRERPAAIAVAHKKFLASRLAEVCLLVAAILLYREWGSLDLTTIVGDAAASKGLPSGASAAAVLIAVAVLLKCAQLPLHGWLIQVMEAPTPVSALLHAGVVNLGGYVLIRLAPLISASLAAQTVLVIAGSLSATLAGLVMSTRISIKVRLAWSTCSQMGLMVMECGLGLYDLALLHLLAHALYKAHAFLTAGEAVRMSMEREFIHGSRRPIAPAPLRVPTLALVSAALIVGASSAAWNRILGVPVLPWINGALLSFGVATLLWSAGIDRRRRFGSLGMALAAAQMYLGWHWLLSVPLHVPQFASPWGLRTWSLLAFLALYYAQAWSFGRAAARPRSLYDWVHAGFYLDERFTRLTFRLWPPTASNTELETRAGLHP